MKDFEIPYSAWDEIEGKRVWVLVPIDPMDFRPDYYAQCCEVQINSYLDVVFITDIGRVISAFNILAIFDNTQKAKLAVRVLEKYPDLSLGGIMKKCSKIYRRRYHE